MTRRVIVVTSVQQRAARYLVKFNAERGHPTSESIVKIANARPMPRPADRSDAPEAGTAKVDEITR